MKRITSFLCLLACSPLSLLAHPGHGETDGFTITHYFVEPVHVILFVAALSLTVVSAKYIIRKRQQKEGV